MLHHIGGRKHTCPSCSDGLVQPRDCLFFNADKSLTRYSFSCGNIQRNRGKILSMKHGVYHVVGLDVQGKHVWKSFDTLKEARAFLRKP